MFENYLNKWAANSLTDPLRLPPCSLTSYRFNLYSSPGLSSFSQWVTNLNLLAVFHVEPVSLLDGKTDPEWKLLNTEIVRNKVPALSDHFYQSRVCSAGICRQDRPECPGKWCGNILQTFSTPEKHLLMVRDVVVLIVEWGLGVTDLLVVGGRWGSGTCSDILTFSHSNSNQ